MLVNSGWSHVWPVVVSVRSAIWNAILQAKHRFREWIEWSHSHTHTHLQSEWVRKRLHVVSLYDNSATIMWRFPFLITLAPHSVSFHVSCHPSTVNYTTTYFYSYSHSPLARLLQPPPQIIHFFFTIYSSFYQLLPQHNCRFENVHIIIYWIQLFLFYIK